MPYTTFTVNKPPVNTVPGAQTVNEDTDLAIAGLAIADPDDGGAAETTTLSVLYGTLTVASAGGAAVTGSGTSTVTLNGTVAQINTTLAALGNVVYRGTLNFNGADTLTVLTNDNGAGGGSPRTDTDLIGITVTPVDDAPTINSNGGGATSTVAVPENSTAVTDVNATDPDAGAVVTFALAGGADQARFNINASTGVLSFKVAPNFEAPTDAGANNSYIVRVNAVSGGLTDTQTITVNVTDVAPQILGTNGPNTLNGTTENDTIRGLAGNDRLFGGVEDDTLLGATGNDVLNGGLGNDLMNGGPGNDQFIVNSAGDQLQDSAASIRCDRPSPRR